MRFITYYRATTITGTLPRPVLRKADEVIEHDGVQHTCHRILGDYYVHGIMFRKAILEDGATGVQKIYLV